MATAFSGTSGLTNGTAGLGSDFVDLLGDGRIKLNFWRETVVALCEACFILR